MRLNEIIDQDDRKHIKAEIVAVLTKRSPSSIGDFSRIVSDALTEYKRKYGPFDNIKEEDQISKDMMLYARLKTRQIVRSPEVGLARQTIIKDILQISNVSPEELKKLSFSGLKALKDEYTG